ncbi:MAG TPA: polyketide synthase dehydratase domain-containing protein, partial [Anaerolineae bacterium]|nr:polyketide synthase dehydratase domain-containing protein [Anaerolineae bacterium]
DDEEKRVRTVLKKQGEAFAFSVLSQVADAWQEHARGTLEAVTAAPAQYTLSDIESRCAEQTIERPLEQARLGGFELQRRTIRRGSLRPGEGVAVDSIVIVEQAAGTEPRSMEFGPRWHSLQWVKLGAQEGLACLELPETFADDFQLYQLHPALLDFATSFLRLFKSQGSYLPLSYKRLRLWRPLPRRLYSYVRFAPGNQSSGVTLRFDVVLLDEQGSTLVEIEEFAVMRVDDVRKLGSSARLSSGSLDPHVAGATPRSAISRSAETRRQLLQADLEGGLSSQEGVAVFERLLGSTLKRVIVSTRDLAARIEHSRTSSVELLSEPAKSAATSEPKHPRPKLLSTYAAPRNETEQKLVEIWQNVLGIEPIGIHDNFFELGGDSLLVTRIHAQFIERFGKIASVANLLQYPTVADLAQFVLEQAKAEPPSFEEVHDRTSKQKEAMKRRKQKTLTRKEVV